MKKLLAIVLLLIMFVVPVFADENDLSSLSLEELTALLTRVETEIGTRFGEEWTILGAGQYIAGTSIKPGVYEVICTESRQTYENYIFTMLMFNSIDDYKENPYSPTWRAGLSKPGERFTITLDEGQVLIVHAGYGLVRQAKGFFIP